eukprot:Opistho-2@46162
MLPSSLLPAGRHAWFRQLLSVGASSSACHGNPVRGQCVGKVAMQIGISDKRNYSTPALPKPTIVHLRNARTGTDVFVVGTAHVSLISAEEVKEVIRNVKPNTVMLELCNQRALKMQAQSKAKGGFSEDVDMQSVVRYIKTQTDHAQKMGLLPSAGGKTAGVTNPAPSIPALLKGVEMARKLFGGSSGSSDNFDAEQMGKQFYGFAKQLGIYPGMEFKVAMGEAAALKAKLILGDIPIDKTLSDVSSAFQAAAKGFSPASIPAMAKRLMSTGIPPIVKHILSLPANASAEDIKTHMLMTAEIMKNREKVRQLRVFMDEMLPTLAMSAILHKRDEHMSKVLHLIEEKRAVAVVGFAHLDGIEKNWELLNR